MSGFHPFDLLDPLSPSFSFLESSLSTFPFPSLLSPQPPPPALLEERHNHYLGFALDLLNPFPVTPFHLPPQCLLPSPSITPLDLLAVSDPVAFDRSAVASFRRLREQADTELCLRDLSDRVAALELGIGRARRRDLDRKYTWTEEISGPKGLGLDRKYKWTAESKAAGDKALRWTAAIKGAEEDEGFDRKYKWAAEAKGIGEGNVKWTAELKGRGKHSPLSRTYTWAASTKPREEEEEERTVCKKEKQKKKGKEEKEGTVHVVEIKEKNPGAIAVRKVFVISFSWNFFLLNFWMRVLVFLR